MSAEAAVQRRRFPDLAEVARNFAAVFADPKTMFGIKLGLAGMLAVYLSRLIRLDHANWALLTVIVLAPSQYVGAIGQRSIARVVRTIVGGFVGVWLVGNYEQDRLFFVLLFGLVAMTIEIISPAYETHPDAR